MPNGPEAKLFTFDSPNGFSVSITNYGGIITSIKAPDRNGNLEEVTAGFSSLEEYLKGHPHFGAIVGRFANRIAKGKFSIEGKEFNLPINNGLNHLHGGDNGFHTKLWDYTIGNDAEKATLKLNYTSPHMEEGYPGNLSVEILYTIHDSNSLEINFEARTDETTHVNLTSHGYFNLNGFKAKIFDHQLSLNSSNYVEVDETQIPTGKLVECHNTPFDFSKPKLLGHSILAIPGGTDHCFVLNKNNDYQKPAAVLVHPESGRSLTVYCTHPGIQVYTGNSLDGTCIGHNGTIYHKHFGVCLEMQHFPDTPNQPNFPSTLIKNGEIYKQRAKLEFGIS